MIIKQSWADSDMRTMHLLDDGRLVLVWHEDDGDIVILVPDPHENGGVMTRPSSICLNNIFVINRANPKTQQGRDFLEECKNLGMWLMLNETLDTQVPVDHLDYDEMTPVMALLYEAAKYSEITRKEI